MSLYQHVRAQERLGLYILQEMAEYTEARAHHSI
jgi:hypothetical protein